MSGRVPEPAPVRPFVDRPVGDPGAADRAARVAARRWDLAEPAIVRRGMNAIYAAGDVILRVGHPTAPARSSLELADRLRAAGIAVPGPARPEAIEHDDAWVTAWERVVPSGAPVDWGAVGSMVRRLHELRPADLPPAYPVPSPARFPWWDFARLLDEVGPSIDGAARAGLEAAVARWPDWSDPRGTRTVICHGDVHPGNVIMTAEGPYLLDWDLVCAAVPAWDHAPLMTWSSRWGGAPGLYERFAAGYGWSARGDPHAEAAAELRLVAATMMRVRAALGDPAAGEEAERRLRYWRGDPAAPSWRAQ